MKLRGPGCDRWIGALLGVGLVLILLLDGAAIRPARAVPGRSATGRAASRRITAGGERLLSALDSMDVEARWRPGEPVDWRSGLRDPGAAPLRGHCSAFVAAVCAAFDVYILRPPAHDERLLANAQCDWLRHEGAARGWTQVPDGAAAQSLANHGRIVVACYRNPDRTDAGHVAIVRPSAKGRARIDTEGPDIVQAGARNYRRTTARNGFRLHSKAWRESRILYYAHEIP